MLAVGCRRRRRGSDRAMLPKRALGAVWNKRSKVQGREGEESLDDVASAAEVCCPHALPRVL